MWKSEFNSTFYFHSISPLFPMSTRSLMTIYPLLSTMGNMQEHKQEQQKTESLREQTLKPNSVRFGQAKKPFDGTLEMYRTLMSGVERDEKKSLE